MSGLREPFPPEQIGYIPKAGKQFAFVSHGHVTERLLDHAPDYEFRIEPGFFATGLEADASVGVLASMTIDGRTRMEVGNGKNVKDAVSDAFKRCAMRFGVALDLWVGGEPAPQAPSKPIAFDNETATLENSLREAMKELGTYENDKHLVVDKRDAVKAKQLPLAVYKKWLKDSEATARDNIKAMNVA